MLFKNFLSRIIALALVIVIGLMGCTSNPSGLTGNYSDDTAVVLNNLKTAIELPKDAPNQKEVVTLARQQISDYASRYRRNEKTAGLRSFTTMQTALNALAGYYSSYGVRPLPDKLKKRLRDKFRQVEISLKRGV